MSKITAEQQMLRPVKIMYLHNVDFSLAKNSKPVYSSVKWFI